jgi:hypothetical protein
MVSRYIWRGGDYGHPVNVVDDSGETYNNSPAIQPGLEYSFDGKFSGLYLGIWGSMGLGDKSTQKLDELDPYIGYDFSAYGVDYSIGYTYYTFPSIAQQAASSLGEDKKLGAAAYDTDFFEWWIGAGFPKIIFEPSLTFYYGWGNSMDSQTYYTDLGLTLPSLPYDIGVGLNLGFTGGTGNSAQTATLLTDITLGLSKDVNIMGADTCAYMNYVGIVSHSDSPDNYVVNDEEAAYEIVFGIKYSGSIL